MSPGWKTTLVHREAPRVANVENVTGFIKNGDVGSARFYCRLEKSFSSVTLLNKRFRARAVFGACYIEAPATGDLIRLAVRDQWVFDLSRIPMAQV
jgi:hypothetical protein